MADWEVVGRAAAAPAGRVAAEAAREELRPLEGACERCGRGLDGAALRATIQPEGRGCEAGECAGMAGGSGGIEGAEGPGECGNGARNAAGGSDARGGAVSEAGVQARTVLHPKPKVLFLTPGTRPRGWQKKPV